MDSSIVFDKIKKFFTGDLFIVAAAAVVFIGWVTGLWAAFLCVLALLCTAPLIFTSSNRSLLVFFMQFTFRKQRSAPLAFVASLATIRRFDGGFTFPCLQYLVSLVFDYHGVVISLVDDSETTKPLQPHG